MIDAADDYVAAYTTTREALTKIIPKVASIDAYGGEDVPQVLREQCTGNAAT